MSFIFKLFNKIFQLAFWANCCIILLAALTPFVQPKHFSALTFIAIVFPYLLITLLFWLLFFLIKKDKKIWIVILLMLLNFKNIHSTFGFHFFTSPTTNKAPNSLRVLSWNVNNFICNPTTNRNFKNTIEEMRSVIKNSNADVLCFQDFEIRQPSDPYKHLAFIRDSMHYPYFFYAVDVNFYHTVYKDSVRYGTCIFSRYPITNSIKINYVDEPNSESLAAVDVLFNGKQVRIYNTHLKSMFLAIKKDSSLPDLRCLATDTNAIMHSTKSYKLKYFDKEHCTQAEKIAAVFDTTKLPFIFCGDINSTPASFVYHTITAKTKDAFVTNKAGFGATYKRRFSLLRIDVMLYSQGLHSSNYQSAHTQFSDHKPVIVDFALN